MYEKGQSTARCKIFEEFNDFFSGISRIFGAYDK